MCQVASKLLIVNEVIVNMDNYISFFQIVGSIHAIFTWQVSGCDSQTPMSYQC